jgi:hypothetical protein
MAQYLVTTVVPGFTGDVGTVHFADGVALIDDETDAATLAYCRSAGYTVEAPEAGAEPEPEEPDEADEAGQPKKSASTEAWRTWAVEHGGMEADEAATLSRDQLVERFTTTEETPA